MNNQLYAVVQTGGKQYKVTSGQVLDVELIGGKTSEAGSKVALQPVMLVDGGDVLATPEELSGVKVAAVVKDQVKANKITGFTYKSKSNQRRRWGHRQKLSRIEITEITRK